MILGVTQARLSSTRFPKKIIQKVSGQSILEIHLKRLMKSKKLDKILVAFADEPGIEEMERIVDTLGVAHGRGSVDDVLSRFYTVAASYNPTHIVRLTTDCPLIDPSVVDEVISLSLEKDADYVSNTQPATFADGFDVEVVKWSAFERAYNDATQISDREHVTKFIWRQPHIFTTANFENKVNDSQFRLTLDYPEDFQVLNELIKRVGLDATHQVYVNVLKQDPELRSLNEKHSRNEALKGQI